MREMTIAVATADMVAIVVATAATTRMTIVVLMTWDFRGLLSQVVLMYLFQYLP